MYWWNNVKYKNYKYQFHTFSCFLFYFYLYQISFISISIYVFRFISNLTNTTMIIPIITLINVNKIIITLIKSCCTYSNISRTIILEILKRSLSKVIATRTSWDDTNPKLVHRLYNYLFILASSKLRHRRWGLSRYKFIACSESSLGRLLTRGLDFLVFLSISALNRPPDCGLFLMLLRYIRMMKWTNPSIFVGILEKNYGTMLLKINCCV